MQAAIHELKRLRCNLCGTVFTAQVPQGVGPDKYDVTVASIIGLLKYGRGMPFHSLAGLQGDVEVPLPAATQWKIVDDGARASNRPTRNSFGKPLAARWRCATPCPATCLPS